VPGLSIHVGAGGAKSYLLKAAFPGSRHRARRLIGAFGALSLDQARAEARRWLELLRQGLDPRREREEQRRRVAASAHADPIFATVCAAYFEHRLRGRQAERSALEIRRELLSVWGGRRISDISKGDIIALSDALRARAERKVGTRSSGAYARIIFAHCCQIFNFAATRFDLERVPTDRLRPRDLGLRSRLRTRTLSDDEIRALWKATAIMSYPFGAFVRLLLFTGCRRSEASAARWSEFDLAARIWTIPAARHKVNVDHRIPLTDTLLELLNGLPKFKSGDFVFSANYGRTPLRGFSKATARLLRLSGLPHFTLHDLRRTMRTRLSEIGIAERVAEAAIGHAARNALVRIYDQYQWSAEIRSALEQWHARLAEILEGFPKDT
jgi:integrase